MTLRAMITGFGLGAGLAYLTDEQQGARRRARLADQLVHWRTASDQFLHTAVLDLSQRSGGLGPTLRARLVSAPVSDTVLAARVRSQLGRYVSHPRAIRVTAHEGLVMLEGPILRREHLELMPALAAVPGVTRLSDRLEVHDAPGRIPALQGGKPRLGGRPLVLRENWPPGVRLAVGALGGLLTLRGLARRGLKARLGGAVGAAMLTRAIANRPIGRAATAAEGFSLTKTLTIHAPVDAVYEIFQHPENFPRFMRHVLTVEPLGEGRHHWAVRGPAGVPVAFDSVMTRAVAGEAVAWRSEPGAAVEHTGEVQLEENPDGTTRLHLQMSYHPPAGLVGHAVATFLGANPKHELDEDLNALKVLLEQTSVGTRQR